MMVKQMLNKKCFHEFQRGFESCFGISLSSFSSSQYSFHWLELSFFYLKNAMKIICCMKCFKNYYVINNIDTVVNLPLGV